MEMTSLLLVSHFAAVMLGAWIYSRGRSAKSPMPEVTPWFKSPVTVMPPAKIEPLAKP